MNLADVRERDMWLCARCGSHDWLQVHHRRLRSQGGPDTFSNLITLCAKCHEWCHRNPAAARADGWMLGRGNSPEQVPVDHVAWPSGPVLLADDGTVSFWQQG